MEEEEENLIIFCTLGQQLGRKTEQEINKLMREEEEKFTSWMSIKEGKWKLKQLSEDENHVEASIKERN